MFVSTHRPSGLTGATVPQVGQGCDSTKDLGIEGQPMWMMMVTILMIVDDDHHHDDAHDGGDDDDNGDDDKNDVGLLVFVWVGVDEDCDLIMAVSAAMFEMTSDCMSLGSNLNCSHQLHFPMGLPRQLTGFPMVDASVRPASPPFWPWQSVSEVYQLSKVINKIMRDRCIRYQDFDRPCMLIRDIYRALEHTFGAFAPDYTVVLACLWRHQHQHKLSILIHRTTNT